MIPRGSESSDSSYEDGSRVPLTKKSKVEQRTDSETGIYTSLQRYGTFVILFVVSLLCQVDDSAISGIIDDIQKHFNIGPSQTSLLRTSRIIIIMIVSPLCGYMGDRYDRKFATLFSIFIWSASNFASTFCVSSQNFLMFLSIRSISGIGEAYIACIAPTVLNDLFDPSIRGLILSIFIVAQYIGNLGLVLGAVIGYWVDQLRFCPSVSTGLIFLLMFLFPFNLIRAGPEIEETTEDLLDPEAKKLTTIIEEKNEGISEDEVEPSSYYEDLKSLGRNKVYILVVIGFFCKTFNVGGLSFWLPQMAVISSILRNETVCDEFKCDDESLLMTFGIVAVLSGLAGLATGLILSNSFKNRGIRAPDLSVCIISVLIITIADVILFYSIQYSQLISWCSMILAVGGASSSLALTIKILMETVDANRRATATAVAMTCSYSAYALSPFIVGTIYGTFSMNETNEERFHALQQSLLICPAVSLIGAGSFIFARFILTK